MPDCDCLLGRSLESHAKDHPGGTNQTPLLGLLTALPDCNRWILSAAIGALIRYCFQICVALRSSMKEGEYRTPGEVLGWASEYVAGSGTYVRNQKVHASVVGRRRVVPATPDSDHQKPTIEVRRERERGAVPEPGAIVTAKITKLQHRMASADIVCVGLQAIKEKFTGIVRQQDVRATEIDKVEMHTSFRPGDIIRAEVLSLGDSRAYYLSTAKNELGVVSATSDAGVEMVPVSWQEMQCPVTGQKEFRKVAKVT